MEANRSFADPLPMNADFGPIDLARAAPFSLGAIEVRPATREISAAGAAEVLQPRIMQVLVALGARAGEVVSRDELIRLCWDGQVVGDDAINRCIAKLRQLGEAHAAFEIVTIARVGYRLDARQVAVGVPVAMPGATPVLAVLPFENLSSDPEMQFFSDGVSEEILSALARIAGLRVIGSTSSFSLRGARKSEAAKALGATHVLDGSVQRSGKRVRVSTEFTDAESGQVLWRERYDRQLQDVFALQDEIALATASALSARFAPAAPKPPLDPQATDLYLRALSMRKAHDPGPQERAIAYLEAALAIEPDFARARGALALSLCNRIVAATVISAPPEAFDAAVRAVETAARRALAQDPGDTQARYALLSLEPMIGAWAAHEAAIDAALEDSPNDGQLLTAKGRMASNVGRRRAAQAISARAVADDPLSPRAIAFDAGRRFLIADDEAGARAAVDRAYAMAPTDPLVWRLRSRVLALQEDHRESLAMLDRATEVGQTPERVAFIRASLNHALSAAPRSETPVLRHGPKLIRDSPFVMGAILFTLIALNDFYEEAFAVIDQAMALHPPDRLWSQWNAEGLNVSPTAVFFIKRTAPFRAHPRFLPLCARLGFCAYWAETGVWPDFIVDAPNRGELEAQVRKLAACAAQ